MNSRFPITVIRPGDIYVTEKQEVLRTLLGSCVAICLYDVQTGVMGMNHIMLTREEEYLFDSQEKIGRYAHESLRHFLKLMEERGANLKRLKAKAFGGSQILRLPNKNPEKSVAAANVYFVQNQLSTLNIELVSFDLGGNSGRTVFFFPKTYSVYVRKIRSSMAS